MRDIMNFGNLPHAHQRARLSPNTVLLEKRIVV